MTAVRGGGGVCVQLEMVTSNEQDTSSCLHTAITCDEAVLGSHCTAEARIGSRWWLPLKCLNQQQHDAATGGSHTALEREWQQQDQVWRSTWDKIKAGHLQNTLAVEHEQAKLVQQQRVERELEAELSSESSWIKCETS